MQKYFVPLYEFSGLENDSFEFSSCPFSIKRFNCNLDLAKAMSLSIVDRVHIQEAEWALLVNSESYASVNQSKLIGSVQNDLNLLILVFRFLRLGPWPFIEHLIPQNLGEEPIVFYDTMQRNSHEGTKTGTYDKEKLLGIDSAYGILKKADSERKYARAHNAIYFAYLATHTIHWIQSFVFWMSALEALFSKDSRGGATSTIKRRVSAYIGDANIATEDNVEMIYDIRSRIVHGDIRASQNTPDKNLQTLWMIETIACACFSKLIVSGEFSHYANKTDRNLFVQKFD